MQGYSKEIVVGQWGDPHASGLPKRLLDFSSNVELATQIVPVQFTQHRQFPSRTCADAPFLDHASGLPESRAEH